MDCKKVVGQKAELGFPLNQGHPELAKKFDFEPDSPSKCQWATGKPKTDSPHHHLPYPRNLPKILPNILYHIGETPMVRLNHISKDAGLKCELLGKCEYFNAGGSVKDRIGVRMVEEAERAGKLKQGMTIIEPTAGNTGIGLAIAAVVKGYRCIMVMPDKMSLEKENILKALGAEIVRTPTSADYDTPESYIGVALRLSREIPNSIFLDQYHNVGNSLAHYDYTAEEILEQCDGKVDMVVVGAGTGGTIAGIGRKLKEKCPDCIIVGVDPVGSVLAQPEELNKIKGPYLVEGIGYDFVPTVLDRSVVDFWIKSEDKESFLMARRLIREEGLLVGGSSGSNVWAALQFAKKMKAGQRCVVLLPDGVRNYMTKFLSDSWMAERDFTEPAGDLINRPWWWSLKVDQLPLSAPVTVSASASIKQAIDILEREEFDQLPVVGNDGAIVGVITQSNLIAQLAANKAQLNSSVENVICREFKQISSNITLGKLSYVFDSNHFVLVLKEQKKGAEITKDAILGVVTRIDLLKFISREDYYQNGSTSMSRH